LSAIQTLVILLIEKSATRQKHRKTGQNRKQKELITIYMMNHYTDNREDEDVKTTTSTLDWLEEKLAGTIEKEERKTINASILLAQTEHKHALIKDANERARASSEEGGTKTISDGVEEIVFLDNEEDTDHVMSDDNNKRSNDEDAEMK